jgi:hypothetical protein
MKEGAGSGRAPSSIAHSCTIHAMNRHNARCKVAQAIKCQRTSTPRAAGSGSCHWPTGAARGGPGPAVRTGPCTFAHITTTSSTPGTPGATSLQNDQGLVMSAQCNSKLRHHWHNAMVLLHSMFTALWTSEFACCSQGDTDRSGPLTSATPGKQTRPRARPLRCPVSR